MKPEAIRKFCDKALLIHERGPAEAGTIGYSARFLVQTTLPHRDPGGVEAWSRKNGNFSLTLQPGMISGVDGKSKSIGLPFGSIPRLILTWISTEVKIKKSREIIIDDSMSSFMKILGMGVTGGKNGSIQRFKEQMNRLFGMSIFLYDEGAPFLGDQTIKGARIQVAKSYHLSWNKNSAQKDKSYVILDQDFFDRIIERPIPIDIRALKTLKGSPLALDLYSWLTYRYSYLGKKTLIPWRDLVKQLGSEFSNTPQGIQGFKRATLRSLQKINAFWQINVDIQKDHLVLHPQSPHVKKIGR